MKSSSYHQKLTQSIFVDYLFFFFFKAPPEKKDKLFGPQTYSATFVRFLFWGAYKKFQFPSLFRLLFTLVIIGVLLLSQEKHCWLGMSSSSFEVGSDRIRERPKQNQSRFVRKKISLYLCYWSRLETARERERIVDNFFPRKLSMRAVDKEKKINFQSII